jgi:hypothetical protein
MKNKTTRLLLAVLLILPNLLSAQETFTLDGSGNKTHTYKNSTGVTNTELEYRGKIIFTDDETDVKYISPGGFLKFSKRSFGNKRIIILEGESNNQINREYREGSKELPFEPDGRKWMASVLPEIIRTTGIGAEERAKKFYANGGIDALIKEIDMLPTNYVRRIYYDASFKIPGLKTKDMVVLVNDASENITSSYELSQILTNNSEVIGKNDQAVAAAMNVAKDIGSSYEQSRVFRHYLTKVAINSTNKALVIKNVREIGSSYEQSKVLQAIIEADLSKENVNLVFTEVEHISSSYEQSKVLQLLISKQTTADLDVNKLLETVDKISSSYEQAKVLTKLINSARLNSSQIIAISKGAKIISSSNEKSKLLQSIMKEQTVDEASINAILETAHDVSSSYEQSQVVRLAIANKNFTSTNFASVIKVSMVISSSYEQSKVLGDLIELKSVPEKYMIELIEAINTVSSSYERSKLLQKLAPQLSANKEIRDAFFNAAEGLSNDEYGKVMRAVTNK